jgi:hypothetical protein
MIIKTTKGQPYALLSRIIREIDSAIPWIVRRADIKAALRKWKKEPRVTLYVGGTPTQTELTEADKYGPVRLYKNRGEVQIGCKQFIGVNATKLRRWALR